MSETFVIKREYCATPLCTADSALGGCGCGCGYHTGSHARCPNGRSNKISVTRSVMGIHDCMIGLAPILTGDNVGPNYLNQSP